MLTSAIFRPARVGRASVPNRVVLSPMTRAQADGDGTPTEAMAQYYAHYASAGVGLLITEATYVDGAQSRAYFNQPGMTCERHLRGWAAVVDAVHHVGRPLILQLQHGGRLAEPGLHPWAMGATGAKADGLSWQRARPYSEAPVRAATDEELVRIVESFAHASQRARDAGFDGVEIHGARGYLVDELLSAPGRSLDDRLRVPLAVVRAVRRGFRDGIVGYNWSLYKMTDPGYRPPGGKDEVEQIARALIDAGVDLLHVSTRDLTRVEPLGEPFACVVRRAVPRAALILNGGIRTLEDAERALRDLQGDFVAMARALLANPDWIERATRGLPLREFVRGMEHKPLLEPFC
jgi:2,4-dienoyl-CoA reductase-like NADH-dependent reductase (Old Yellow Enzyme family)